MKLLPFAFVAALGRNDYQLVRTAAIGVKGQTSNKYVLDALRSALERITAQRSETSRDTRLELMGRLREAGASQAPRRARRRLLGVLIRRDHVEDQRQEGVEDDRQA